MNECQRIGDLLTPYVDEALDAVSREGVERHVAACPPCRARLVSEHGARTVLRRCADSLTTPLPPGLQSRCQSLLSEALVNETTSQRGWSQRPWAQHTWADRLRPIGLGAAVLASLVILVFLATTYSNSVLAAQLAADHVKCFSLFPPADQKGIEQREAEHDLAANGWDMTVPASSAANSLRLIGVRGCLTGAGAIPHVLYEAGGKPLSLFKLQGTRRAESLQMMGRQCRIWHRGDSTFVLVAEGPAGPELTRVAEYVEKEAR